MTTSYDEIAELATQPADQQSAEEQPKGIGTARPTRRQAAAAVELLLRWAMILRVKGWLTRLRV